MTTRKELESVWEALSKMADVGYPWDAGAHDLSYDEWVSDTACKALTTLDRILAEPEEELCERMDMVNQIMEELHDNT